MFGPSHSSMIMTGLTPGGCSDSMCRVFQSSIISYRVFEYEAPHGHCARYIVIGCLLHIRRRVLRRMWRLFRVFRVLVCHRSFHSVLSMLSLFRLYDDEDSVCGVFFFMVCG